MRPRRRRGWLRPPRWSHPRCSADTSCMPWKAGTSPRARCPSRRAATDDRRRSAPARCSAASCRRAGAPSSVASRGSTRRSAPDRAAAGRCPGPKRSGVSGWPGPEVVVTQGVAPDQQRAARPALSQRTAPRRCHRARPRRRSRCLAAIEADRVLGDEPREGGIVGGDAARSSARPPRPPAAGRSSSVTASLSEFGIDAAGRSHHDHRRTVVVGSFERLATGIAARGHRREHEHATVGHVAQAQLDVGRIEPRQRALASCGRHAAYVPPDHAAGPRGRRRPDPGRRRLDHPRGRHRCCPTISTPTPARPMARAISAASPPGTSAPSGSGR